MSRGTKAIFGGDMNYTYRPPSRRDLAASAKLCASTFSSQCHNLKAPIESSSHLPKAPNDDMLHLVILFITSNKTGNYINMFLGQIRLGSSSTFNTFKNQRKGTSLGMDRSSGGSQLCVYICVPSALPIRLIKPCFKTTCLAIREHHISYSASKTSDFRKYIAFKTCELRAWGSRTTCHISFANKGKLKISTWWKPKPPMYFGLVLVSQVIHAVFLLPVLLSQQSFGNSPLMCQHGPRGNLKHAIEFGDSLCHWFNRQLFVSEE